MEKIIFDNDGEQIEFFVLEQTVLGGITYILVTEDEGDEDADAYILKEISQGDDEATYEMVEDDVTLEALGKVFSELLEDVDVV